MHARLAYTTDTSMCLAVEVRSGAVHGAPLEDVVHCVAVYTAVDASDQPRTVDRWRPRPRRHCAGPAREGAHRRSAAQ